MLLHELVATSARVAATRKRLEKIELLAERLRALAPEEARPGAAYLAGELPQGRIGPALVRELRGAEAARDPSLAVLDVDRAFDAVRDTTGAGSKQRKLERLGALFARTTREEQGFLSRLIVGELRHGALEGLLHEALARASEVPAAEIRRAAMLGGSWVDVAEAVLTEGRAGLARFRLTCGQPLLPMLAQPAESATDALERLGGAGLEWKLDGARVQVHKLGADVRIFTRRLNDVTAALPELVEAARAYPARELILDGEALAHAADGRPLPFQTTMRRFGRKRDVAALREELPVTPWYFDVLYADGEELIDRPYDERAARLAALVPETSRTPRIVTADPGEVDAFFARALAAGHEGLVAKALDAPYEAGRRGAHWLKLKPAHTLDLVVLAAEWGSGRRRGTLSNLHLGARDPESAGTFVMLGKTFKGLTDETLARQTEALLALETHRDAHVVHVRPELVAEIAFDGVQTSPHYPGGVALRFARLRRYRPDKRAADADTIDAVRALLAT